METIHNLPSQNHRPAGYEWRPAVIADVPALVELYAAADADCDTHWGGPAEEIRNDFEEPGFDNERDSLVAIAPGGRFAALGWILSPQQTPEKRSSTFWLITHPDYYHRGLGEAIFSWIEARLQERARETQKALPLLGRSSALDTLTGRIRLYEHHGFTPRRAYFRMQRNLAEEIPPGLPPDGVRLIPWDARNDEAAFHVSNAAFEDHWGSSHQSSEHWKLFTSGSASFRPDLSLMALAGDRVVGISINRAFEDEIARTGIREGWIGTVGVLREWRNRGLATALLCDSMRRFQAAGFDQAGLRVDSENLTGALGLYQHLGFVTIQRSLMYAKEYR